MALIGQGAWSVDVKLFDDTTQGWPEDFTHGVYRFYSGQGFELPNDIAWINRPTGEMNNGMVMAFPRSAEPQPNQGGAPQWYVTEA